MEKKADSGRRFTITLIYVLVFWVLLPVALAVPSVVLDRRGLRLRSSRLRKAVSIPLFLSAAYMLIKSIRDFSRGAAKLPITALPPYNRLARKGVYAAWRHPVYLFYTLMAVAVALFASSGGFLVVVLPVFAAVEIIHAAIEERWLLRKHGRSYELYRREAGVVIPKLKNLKEAVLWK